MFTGIIEAVGSIVKLQAMDDDMQIQVTAEKLDFSDVKLGDSIAVNGVCLTVTRLSGNQFWADISGETLRCSTFKQLKVGARVNLEKALTLSSRLGGHLVAGHVDGIGSIVEIHHAGRSIFYKIRAPKELLKYIAEKGSITVDGTSLTVNAIAGNDFELNIIPQTLMETIFKQYQVGSLVNLEIDLMARYIERLLLAETSSVKGLAQKESKLTQAFLANNGFV